MPIDWKKEPALAGVRDPDALARLPKAEQVEWNEFWAGVDAKSGLRSETQEIMGVLKVLAKCLARCSR